MEAGLDFAQVPIVGGRRSRSWNPFSRAYEAYLRMGAAPEAHRRRESNP